MGVEILRFEYVKVILFEFIRRLMRGMYCVFKDEKRWFYKVSHNLLGDLRTTWILIWGYAKMRWQYLEPYCLPCHCTKWSCIRDGSDKTSSITRSCKYSRDIGLLIFSQPVESSGSAGIMKVNSENAILWDVDDRWRWVVVDSQRAFQTVILCVECIRQFEGSCKVVKRSGHVRG